MTNRVPDKRSTPTLEESHPERRRGFLSATGYELMLASVDDRIYAELDRESREQADADARHADRDGLATELAPARPVASAPLDTQAESATESVLIDADKAAQLMGITLKAFLQRKQRGTLPPGCIVQNGRRVQYHRAKLLASIDRNAR
jgi:hypothetical protein